MPSEHPLVEEKIEEVVAQVAEVSVDVSIPCDTAAKNCDDASNESMGYAD